MVGATMAVFEGTVRLVGVEVKAEAEGEEGEPELSTDDD